MREIKFRAWDNNNKKIIFDLGKRLRNHYDGDNYRLVCDEMIGDDYFEYPLMQYTGLKDKNGVEIYEGDVVKDNSSLLKDNRANNIVRYEIDDARFSFGGWQIPSGMMHRYEVIGNIYENPELLS